MADTRPQTQSIMTDRCTQSEQRVLSSGQRAIQEGISSSRAVTPHRVQLPKPNWPTSRPGPLAKQPPSGQRPINLLRREQMVEVGYLS
jgi:hypothetical protein